jgi:hypothetical protein
VFWISSSWAGSKLIVWPGPAWLNISPRAGMPGKAAAPVGMAMPKGLAAPAFGMKALNAAKGSLAPGVGAVAPGKAWAICVHC